MGFINEVFYDKIQIASIVAYIVQNPCNNQRIYEKFEVKGILNEITERRSNRKWRRSKASERYGKQWKNESSENENEISKQETEFSEKRIF